MPHFLRGVTRFAIACCAVAFAAAAAARAQTASRSLGEVGLAEFRNVRSAMTFGEWKAAHPTDTVELYAEHREQQKQSEWCVRSIARIPMDSGRTAMRLAYFYAPPPPADGALPHASTPEALRAQCTLGLVWITATETDSARAERWTTQTRTALSAALGNGDSTARVSWNGGAAWRRKALWKTGTMEIVSAARRDTFTGPGGGRRGTTRVMVAITHDTSRVAFSWPRFALECGTATTPRCPRAAQLATLDEAISLASLGGDAESAFRAQVTFLEGQRISFDVRAPAVRREGFIDTLGTWLTAGRRLPAAQRVAALVAADLLLREANQRFYFNFDEDTVATRLRPRLEQLGATFVHASLGSVYAYQRSWLKEALQLEAGGRAHDLAFLMLMEQGFETGLCTDHGGDSFRVVIAKGTEHLQRYPSSSITRDVRLHMARAHADVVTIASGPSYGTGDSLRFMAEAPAARARAIETFTAAFNHPSSTSEFRREHWPTVWRLMAGLPPMRTYFRCNYD